MGGAELLRRDFGSSPDDEPYFSLALSTSFALNLIAPSLKLKYGALWN